VKVNIPVESGNAAARPESSARRFNAYSQN
jgi:hypothetical protein